VLEPASQPPRTRESAEDFAEDGFVVQQIWSRDFLSVLCVRGTPAAPACSDVETIGGEIAVLSAHIHAATQRLLALIAEFDRLRGWERDGQRSCAHWLALRTGIDLGAAREKVRAARCLVRLPLMSAAMARWSRCFLTRMACTCCAAGSRRKSVHC